MAIRKVDISIGGSIWEMNTLPATTGLSCLTRLAAIIGAPAGAAAGGLKQTEGDLLNLDAGAMGDAVAKMTLQLADPSTLDLVKTLLTDLRKDDRKVEFDDYFAANYGELLELLAWSIRENFGSFLAGSRWLGGLADRVQKSIRAT